MYCLADIIRVIKSMTMRHAANIDEKMNGET